MPVFSHPSGQTGRSCQHPVLEALASHESDGQLLERYVRGGDEGAFEQLVGRHARLVYGTCRRVLREEQATEDACQATFVVLARRADSLDGERTLAGWLHEVAYRTALRARAQAARRYKLEQPMPCEPAADPPSDQAWREFLPVLHEELQRLPDKYRQPVILCYLQGKTHLQAAAELKWPSGSVSRRIAHALGLLRGRLLSRGVVLSALLLLNLLGL